MAGISIHRVKRITAALAPQFEGQSPNVWVDLVFDQGVYEPPLKVTVFLEDMSIEELRRLADRINGAQEEAAARIAEQLAEDRRVPRYPDPAEAAE